jgi:polyisoprenyl-teichoic acid--peptidoglycan teichoic acid transferase
MTKIIELFKQVGMDCYIVKMFIYLNDFPLFTYLQKNERITVLKINIYNLKLMVYYPPEKQFDVHRIVNYKGNDFASPKEDPSKRKKKIVFKKIMIGFAVVVSVALFSGGYMVYKANSTFDKITGDQNSVIKSFIRMLPFGNNFFQILPIEKESSIIDKLKNNELDRLNILILGIRGVDDPNGGLLTDTIMVVSIEPKTAKAALISIPRDLYIDIPYQDNKNKINEAYVDGIKNSDWKNGLKYSKKAVFDVTGMDIHYAASVDFKAFKEIIDTLGGVKITLDKPFSEKNQFEEGVISLPAGTQTIDGDTALLFARARFSTSDFDRAKRQQQLLLGVKDKAFSLGVVYNPAKIISILNSLGNHVKTDAELWEIQELASLSRKIEIKDVRKKVFDTSEEGLLYASRDANGSYILLPEGGNFDKIKEVCKNIFE